MCSADYELTVSTHRDCIHHPSRIEAVWRIESAKIVASVARMVRDVGLAEELAQDALVAALEHWPESGIQENPGAWLMAIAKRRAIDCLRRNKLLARKHEELGYAIEAEQEMAATDVDAALDEDIGDDLLRLIFLETSLPGVFAVGDVRGGSIKRVASAVGEGSIAIAFVHQVLHE